MKYKAVNINFPNMSAIGIGHSVIDSSDKRKNISDSERIKLLRCSLDCGMNLIDTAENYGNGKSEEIIGKTLVKSERDKIYISTKVSPENLNFNGVIKSCHDSLKRLQTDYIDIYQIHWPNPDVELKETFDALNKLKDSGFIKHIGVSNFSNYLYRQAKEYANIEVVQLEHNSISQISGADFLSYNEDTVLVIGYSPLHMPPDYRNKFRILEIMEEKYKVTKQQILLNWISNTNNNLIPVAKSNNATNIYSNSKSLDFDIDESDIKILNLILRTRHEYIPMKYIKITLYGREDKEFYQTIQEAVENRFGLYPSPQSLASWMSKYNGHLVKPIKVLRESTDQEKYRYELYEGRVRFWANVIYNNGNMEKTISTIIL